MPDTEYIERPTPAQITGEVLANLPHLTEREAALVGLTLMAATGAIAASPLGLTGFKYVAMTAHDAYKSIRELGDGSTGVDYGGTDGEGDTTPGNPDSAGSDSDS